MRDILRSSLFNLAVRMRCSGRNDSSVGCDGSKGATAGTCDGPKGWNSSTVRCEGRRLRSRQDLNPEREHRRCERSLSIQRVRPGLRPPRRKVRLLNPRPGVRGMGPSDLAVLQPPRGRDRPRKTTSATPAIDRYPASPGHLLVIPYRHVADFFDAELAVLVRDAKHLLGERFHPDGYKVGEVAGQTVMHLHVHVIHPAVRRGRGGPPGRGAGRRSRRGGCTERAAQGAGKNQ